VFELCVAVPELWPLPPLCALAELEPLLELWLPAEVLELPEELPDELLWKLPPPLELEELLPELLDDPDECCPKAARERISDAARQGPKCLMLHLHQPRGKGRGSRSVDAYVLFKNTPNRFTA
jgi:hypothetical protein